MAVTVDYHMTLNSPWTYLGSALFAEIARRNDVTVNIKPCKHARTAAARGGQQRPPTKAASRIV
jgi:2-hydroxychromene-2-carboxylate isomerase